MVEVSPAVLRRLATAEKLKVSAMRCVRSLFSMPGPPHLHTRRQSHSHPCGVYVFVCVCVCVRERVLKTYVTRDVNEVHTAGCGHFSSAFLCE